MLTPRRTAVSTASPSGGREIFRKEGTNSLGAFKDWPDGGRVSIGAYMIPSTISTAFSLVRQVLPSEGALLSEGGSITLAFNRQATVIMEYALELSHIFSPTLPLLKSEILV